jgi:hypothetical protein
MKRFLSLIITVVLIFSIPAVGWCQVTSQENEINATVNKFYNSVEHYNSDEFVSVLTPQAVENIRNDSDANGDLYKVNRLITMGHNEPEDMPKITFTNREVTIMERNSDNARVRMNATVNFNFPRSPEDNETNSTSDILELNLVNGRWLISKLSTNVD